MIVGKSAASAAKTRLVINTDECVRVRMWVDRWMGEVVRCGMVWCGVIPCGVVWRDVVRALSLELKRALSSKRMVNLSVWCGVMWCGVVWCGVVVTDPVLEAGDELLEDVRGLGLGDNQPRPVRACARARACVCVSSCACVRACKRACKRSCERTDT